MIILFVINFIIGIVFLLSSRWSVDPQVKMSMPPQDIEQINKELDIREEFGVLFLLISAFFLIFLII
jgi:hypothetical protein